MAQHSRQQTRQHRTHGTTKKTTTGTSTRTHQRRSVRAAPPPVDYSDDYAFVSRDLKHIALWSMLLFVGMFGVYFFL